MRSAPPNALTGAERDELIAVLNSEEFRDKAVRQVRAALLDRGGSCPEISGRIS